VRVHLRTLHLTASICLAALVSVVAVTDGLAQTSERRHSRAAVRSGPQESGRAAPSRNLRAVAPRPARAVAPTAGRRASSRISRVATPRKRVATPRVQGPVMRGTQPSVALRAGTTARRARVSGSRSARQTIRHAPVNLALVNRGLQRNPGRTKPARVAHDPRRKAGKSGWVHRHRPFVFKHAGHRWRRHYYSFLVGGLWYWYWYDVSVDTDPDVIIYSDAVLPDCDPDSDDCIEPEAVVAPAILEGRATEENLARCAAEFRSFRPDTGTYVTYQGDMRICPYLE